MPSPAKAASPWIRFSQPGGRPAPCSAIASRTAGYPGPRDFFIDRLAEGVGTIAAAFYPKPVIVRMSDFKSNEYAALLGGSGFEPEEENPMIGYRGASRYLSEEFRACFELECRAMKRVRDEMGLTNVEIMVPFVRTVDEARQVIVDRFTDESWGDGAPCCWLDLKTNRCRWYEHRPPLVDE